MSNGRRRLRGGGVVLCGLLLALCLPVSAGDDILLTDLKGDDHGSGDLLYPSRWDFEPGDLDILWLRAESTRGGTQFTAEFRNPIRDPAKGYRDLGPESPAQMAKLGFYTFNLDIYIDQDRQPGSGYTNTMPGRGVDVDRRDAWEKAVILTPRPNMAHSVLVDSLRESLSDRRRVEQGRVEPSFYDNIDAIVEDEIGGKVFFPERVHVSNRTISFFVPDSFLGAGANPNWSYTVIVTGATLMKPVSGLHNVASNLMTMPVTVGRPLNSFGLKHNADPFQPSVVDIVSSQEGYQESILSDYDSVAGRLPAVAGIVPSGGRRLLEMAGPGGGATTTQEILRSQSEDTLTEEYISAGTGVEHLNIGEMLQSVEPEAPRAVQETPAARLRVLEGLRSQGLISEEEYQRIRRKILSEI